MQKLSFIQHVSANSNEFTKKDEHQGGAVNKHPNKPFWCWQLERCKIDRFWNISSFKKYVPQRNHFRFGFVCIYSLSVMINHLITKQILFLIFQNQIETPDSNYIAWPIVAIGLSSHMVMVRFNTTQIVITNTENTRLLW